MGIIITGESGESVEQAVGKRLTTLLRRLYMSAKQMQTSLLDTWKTHVSTLYPNSKHYSPDHITPSGYSTGKTPTAEILIDIPGLCRGWHPHHIVPRFKKALTIPMHASAYGKKASDFGDTFAIWKKNPTGKTVGFIVQRNGSTLTWLFRLCSSVDQKQDSRLVPSDDVQAKNIMKRLKAYLRNA